MKLPFACMLAIALSILGSVTLRADVVFQNFDAFPQSSYFSTVNTSGSTNGWTINDMHIMPESYSFAPSHSGTNVAFFPDRYYSGIPNPTNSYVKTPILSNGVGTVSFYLLKAGGSGALSCQLQTSSNDVDWVTVKTINHTGAINVWVAYTNSLNIYEPVYLRLFRSTTLNDYSWLGIDSISTTEAPAKVDITDHSISPISPTADDPVYVSAALEPSTLASDLAATLYWSANGGASNTISMATNALSGGRYETVTPITNQPAFTVIDYRVNVTFSGPYTLSPTNRSGRFFLRQPTLESAYTNVAVRGGLTQTLELFDDKYWMGVQNVASAGSYNLYFESVNSVTNEWRDRAQSRTTLPVFGEAVTNDGLDIQLDSAPADWLMFSFDEDKGRYGIQQANVQDFNSGSWTALSGSGTIEGWSVTNALATASAGLAFDGNSIQFQSTSDERTIASPELIDGVGTILFRYRNTITNGLTPAAFAIEAKGTSGDWLPVTDVSNIITPDYINYRYSLDNLEFRYVRIAGTGPASAQLLIDDVIVTRPGATVTYTGLTNSPSDPTILDEVDVSVEITAHNGAAINTNSPPTLWFRAFDEDTTYALPITFNNFDGRGTLTDFPALIKLTTANTAGYAGFLDTANGYDLRFWSGTALTGTELDYEIEDFDSNGTSTIWVKIPSLTQGTTILATWGNTNYNYQASCTTNGSVWSEDFGGVWHMSEKNAVDATGNGNNGTAVGGTKTVANGIVGAGNEFDGDLTFDKIDFSAHGLKLQQNRSFSIWLKSDILLGTRGNNRDPGIITGLAGGGTYNYISFNTGSRIAVEDSTDGGTELDVPMGSDFATNTWYHLVVMIESDNKASAYWNGQYCGKDTDSFVDLGLSYLGLGYGFASTAFYYGAFDGIFDEMRFSTVARSSSWVWASYMTIGSHADFTSYGTAGELNAGSIYDPIPMTTTNGTNYTATIPRGARGVMQYYVETSYLDPATGGYPDAYEPFGGRYNPASYTNTDVILGTQIFDNFPKTSYFSAVNTSGNTNGWTINDMHIMPESYSFTPSHSGTNVAFFPDVFYSGIANPTNSYVKTPLLSNGVGQISFYLVKAGGSSTLSCQLQTSSNDVDWVTVETFNHAGAINVWVAYTNTLNIYEPVYLRLFRSTTLNEYSWLGVDSISLTYPPAYVTASDFEVHPAYPSQEEPTSVACTIESATTFHPAFNISGILKYRSNDQVSEWTGWQSVAMDRFGSRFYGDIPAQLNLSEVEYYVEAGFKGYSAAGEDQSPMEFPDDPLSYTSRRYVSAFSNVSIRIDGADVASFEQLGNGMWEGVLEFIDPTNMPAFLISSFGYYDGNTAQSGFYGTWGDNNQYRTNMPLEGTATLGGSAIVIPENAVGQYIIRFDEATGIYSVQLAAVQDFEDWPADTVLFGESYAAAEIVQYAQDFSTWSVNNSKLTADSFDFDDGWINAFSYPANWSIASDTETTASNRNYVINGGIVVTQRVGQAALLAPGIQANVQNNAAGFSEPGVFSFDLRCASPNDFRPAIHPAVTNTHMRIDAIFQTTDMPTNATLDSIGYAYKSIIGNYINTNNYYEGRVVQINATQKRYELWENTGGTFTSRGTPRTVTGTIREDETVQLIFYWNSSSSVKIRFRSNKLPSNQNVDYTDTTALTPAYAFGFNGLDASISVDSVNVYAVTNSSYAIAPTPIYTETFSSDPPTGWDNSGGAWSVSDGRYQRAGYTMTPITAKIMFSTTYDGAGETVETLSNLSHSYYKRYTILPHIATNGYIRVKHDAGSGYLIIDNVERTAWRGTTVSTNGWTATNVWVDTIGETGKGAELRNSRALAGALQAVASPTLAGASVISFDYLPADDATGPVAFAIDYTQSSAPTAWINATAVTNSSSPTDWVHYAYSIPDRTLREDIRRMRIRNLTLGHDDGLVIDNLTVTEPVSLTDPTTWWGYNVLVTDSKPDGIVDDGDNPWLARVAGNRFVAFLNNGSTNDTGGATYNEFPPYAFIQSAYLPEGVGEIRFLYRAWDANASTIQIVGSTNESRPVLSSDSWEHIDTVTVDSTTYQEYNEAIFARDYRFVALRVNSQAGSPGRVAVENITITAPLAADLRLANLRTDPEYPLLNDDVFVLVDVDDLFFAPSGIELDLLFRTGTNTWGDHSSSIVYDMEVIEDRGNSFTFRSLFPIPKKAIDTVVQYQVKATFDGFFAEKSSPKYYRGFTNPDHYWPVDLNRDKPNQTPYYIVFSSRPGQVWINELNIVDDAVFTPFNHQYVELVGVGGVNVGNWKIEVINPYTYTTNASYTIDPGTTMGTVDDDYGFYVLGDSNIPERDDDLLSPLPNSAGIQLVRGLWKIIEDQVSWDVDAWGGGHDMSIDPDRKFVYAGVDSTAMFAGNPLSLIDDGAPGSNKTDFVWSSTSGDFSTIGTTNIDQTLIPWDGPPPPPPPPSPVSISDAVVSSGTVYFTITADEADLEPSVWYLTNLLNATSADWQKQTNGFGFNSSGTTYNVWCDHLTPPVFYSIGINR